MWNPYIGWAMECWQHELCRLSSIKIFWFLALQSLLYYTSFTEITNISFPNISNNKTNIILTNCLLLIGYIFIICLKFCISAILEKVNTVIFRTSDSLDLKWCGIKSSNIKETALTVLATYLTLMMNEDIYILTLLNL